MGGLVVCLGAQASLAAPVFSDGFESGAVLIGNGGKWDDDWVSDPTSCDIDESTAADRRGTYGLRMHDGNGSSGGRTEGQVEKTVSTSPAAYYMRYWFRMTASVASGSMTLSQLCSSSCDEGYGDIALAGDRTVRLEYNPSGVSYQTVTSSPATVLDVGTWYLLEVAATGLKTSNGRVRLWVNGQLRADRSALNFTGKSVGLIVLGQPWTNSGTFRGDLDFDDVYVDDKPLPSHFGVEAPASVATDACVPLKLQLLDSVSNAPAPAPHPVTNVPLALSGTASATLYADAACATSITSVTVDVDSTERTFYVKASAVGSLTVTAGTAGNDFLPGQQTLTVVAGTPPTSPNGTSCTLNTQCTSNFCVDGVCCDTACNGGACDACSQAMGSAASGTCTLLPQGTVCREAAEDCDAEEVCSGSSGACPADALAPASTVCRGAAGVCDVEEQCTGSSPLCPANAWAPATLVCSAETATHEAASCTGSAASCPSPTPKTTSPPDGGTGTPVTPGTDGGDEVPGGPVGPGGGAGGDAEQLCQTPDCMERADVGCSCDATSGPGLAAALAALLLLAARRVRRRS